ncbi:MAG: pyridoxamine 5'-phosphate oxidase [Pseudomonadales bacterium]|nr:pyridoxamine 5'-phosphate oxidase [Pseudomonadales bacterium]
MSLAMTVTERETFLADLHVGVISFVDPAAGPLTAPIWYDYDPQVGLWVIIGPESRKGQLASVGSRISLVAQSEAMPYKYVSVEGPITSIEPSEEGALLSMATRYLGEEMGKGYAAQSTGDNVTVLMNVERWLTVDYGKANLG